MFPEITIVNIKVNYFYSDYNHLINTAKNFEAINLKYKVWLWYIVHNNAVRWEKKLYLSYSVKEIEKVN